MVTRRCGSPGLVIGDCQPDLSTGCFCGQSAGLEIIQCLVKIGVCGVVIFFHQLEAAMFQKIQTTFVVGIGCQDGHPHLVQTQTCLPELSPHSCQVGLCQAEVIGQKLITDQLCNLSCVIISLESRLVFVQVHIHVTQAGQEYRFLPLGV